MDIRIQNRRSKYIKALIAILLVVLSVLKADKAFAAPKASATLANGVAMTVDIKHARAASTEFYNGERVKVDFGFSGGEIAAGSSYSVSTPISPSGDEYAFLLKADSSADVTVNGSKVGKAAYKPSSGKINVTFDTAVSPTDNAVFSLGANLAVKEDSTGSASMAFGVKGNGDAGETPVNVTIPTTSQGYEASVSFSNTTDISGGAVDINIDWQALGGIHAGDYLEIELSKTQTAAFDVYAYINNVNEVLHLTHNGVEYGKITLGRNADGVCKIMFNFTKDSVNVSGTATIKGNWVVNFYDKSNTRPRDATIITLVNGDPRETPITLGEPPKNTLSGVDMAKMHTGGKPIIGRGQPVADGEEFYEFGWTIRVNSKGLPGIAGVSGGETLSNIILKDEVEGPGHYIDLSSIELVVWTDVIMVNGLSQTTFGTMNDLPIVNDQYPDNTHKVRLIDLLPYIGSDKLETVLYGDGDSNHVTGFTLKLGDLPGIAVEMTYKSYLEEGSNAYIPSFRDYFYQSLMTSNGNSDVYKNKMTMTSKEVPEKSGERPVTSNEGSSSITLGSLNLRVKKVDENGSPQTGVKFTLYWSGGSMVVITDENGYIDIPNIGTGLYRLVETAPLSGYKAVEDISFKVPGMIPDKYDGGSIDLLDTATFSSYGGVSDVTSHISLENGKTTGYNEIANYRIGTTNLTV